MPIQIGRTKQVPIYGETSTIVRDLSLNTLSNYFTVTDSGSYYWNKSELDYGETAKALSLKPQNTGYRSGTATITLEAVRDLNDFAMWGRYYTPSVGKITLTVAGETILNAVSGIYGPSDLTTGYYAVVSNRTLAKGDKIVLTYAKTSQTTTSYEAYTEFTITQALNYIDTVSEIVGYEGKIFPQTIKNIYLSPTKKVTSGWIKVLSSAKQFYEGVVFKYTGDYTISEIEINSAAYDLYTLTTSGTLTLKKGAKFWMCGGGSGGENGYASYSIKRSEGGYGGDGGFVESGELNVGTYVIAIGSGGASGYGQGGATSISGDSSYSVNGGNTLTNTKYGGSTGGVGGYFKDGSTDIGLTAHSSQGTTTIPFGVVSLMKHCAGGGGGAAHYSKSGNTTIYTNNGGNGGSNGSTGSKNSNMTGSSSANASGGEYGGGVGSRITASGTAGTFYGAGGGGGYGFYDLNKNRNMTSSGFSGYQGVVYIAIPK